MGLAEAMEVSMSNADREVMSMIHTVIDDANMAGYELHLIDSHSDMALYITKTYPNCLPMQSVHWPHDTP